jgi:hypothetical protein
LVKLETISVTMDILDLLMPVFRGSKDEYGKDIVPPLPLSVERVMENRPFKSTAPLLQLASEILGIILSYVDSDSLGSLALVNSDCRQLARSRQFASVCFDYSNATLGLISLLLHEKTSRNPLNNILGSNVGAIGPCIRRLTVATNPGWVTYRHDVELSSEFTALEQSVRDERLARASDAFSLYKRGIETILSSRAALPHLELLDWEDMVPLEQSFFNSLTTSSIQHLKLFRVSVNQEFEVAQPAVSDRWNLRTLNMDILWSIKRLGEGSTSPLCASFLQSCSHSLETLVWHQVTPENYTFGSNPAKFPRFEKLRNLGLGFVTFGNSGTVNALLEPSLSVLDLKFSSDRLVDEALRDRGRIPSLETLLFSLSKSSIDNYLEFLKANTQISKLTIMGGVNCEDEEPYGAIPEVKILPILSSSFNAIKSLRLSWNENITMIPDVALAMISGLETLEQVCLAAGCQIGWKYDWLIDHKSIRKHLSNLPRLKKIAFTRDSYKQISFSNETNHENYYDHRFPPFEEMEAAGLNWRSGVEARNQLWEDGHKRRMVLEAEKYVAVMPKLEWIYLGQYPMAVTKGASEQERHVVPLFHERDDCDTLLNRTFGWEGLASD